MKINVLKKNKFVRFVCFICGLSCRTLGFLGQRSVCLVMFGWLHCTTEVKLKTTTTVCKYYAFVAFYYKTCSAFTCTGRCGQQGAE